MGASSYKDFIIIIMIVLLCESEKHERFDLTLGFSFAKNWSIFFLY